MNGGEKCHSEDMFDALANAQRRHLLLDLLEHNPQEVAAMSEASREVTEMSSGLLEEYLTGDHDISDAEKDSVRLNSVHLPKLDEYGFIDWQRDEEQVVKGDRFDEIRPLLKLLQDNPEALPDDWL